MYTTELQMCQSHIHITTHLLGGGDGGGGGGGDGGSGGGDGGGCDGDGGGGGGISGFIKLQIINNNFIVHA